ncbi:hypothetical protein PP248_gp30 [Streptococcus phage P9901]|uniref:Uncharacterized protein n=1 Tax=Streptococcus phage P9901 TaxID=1971447 RepID=A0A286QS46_9CAUD|nr:hypothetical protein PP248_gp30 [Streptococcus phage P9901]ARU14723.1 hypothetical protein P9901_30 [Streptococcus phage P9901]
MTRAFTRVFFSVSIRTQPPMYFELFNFKEGSFLVFYLYLFLVLGYKVFSCTPHTEVWLRIETANDITLN